MNVTILKTCIVFLLFWLVCTGCQDETRADDPFKKTADSILGKWQLMSTTTIGDKEYIMDYSADNVIYDFREDNTMIVTADIVDFVGPDPGQYSYELFPSAYKGMCYINLDRYFNKDRDTWCKISASDLIINDSPLDGPVFKFIRVQ